MYAPLCIELDVSKPLLDKLYIGINKETRWYQKNEYEGNNAYCSYCGLPGHIAGLRTSRPCGGFVPISILKHQAILLKNKKQNRNEECIETTKNIKNL